VHGRRRREQLDYQTEAGTWRNLYLTGAKELRDGVLDIPFEGTAGPTDTGEKAMLKLVNGSLNHSLDKTAAEAEGDEISVEPDVKPLAELLELLDEFKIWFNVIEP
jgi:alkyl sulfatase BDS1-like metallo-beta-lactamase superfamily hydrolase